MPEAEHLQEGFGFGFPRRRDGRNNQEVAKSSTSHCVYDSPESFHHQRNLAQRVASLAESSSDVVSAKHEDVNLRPSTTADLANNLVDGLVAEMGPTPRQILKVWVEDLIDARSHQVPGQEAIKPETLAGVTGPVKEDLGFLDILQVKYVY